jgi:hypothetical protein
MARGPTHEELKQKEKASEKRAFEGKQVEAALRESERELNIRNRIAEVFLTTSDNEMYGRVSDVVLEAMKSEYGTFVYINEEGSQGCPIHD